MLLYFQELLLPSPGPGEWSRRSSGIGSGTYFKDLWLSLGWPPRKVFTVQHEACLRPLAC